MRILVITRLYSGLIDSVVSGHWQPKGQIAFCQFLESLQRRRVDFDVILLSKNIDVRIRQLRKIRFDNFQAEFHIVPHLAVIRYAEKLPRLNNFIFLCQDTMHLKYCLKVLGEKKYDLIYTDRVNVSIGAFFSLVLKKRVVFRLNGVISLYRQFQMARTKFIHPLKYFSYFAPFDYIICNDDGTPCLKFLERFRNKKVPYRIILNGGVKYESNGAHRRDSFRDKYDVPQTTPVILFVGRLTRDKGCLLFLKSLIKLNAINPKFCSFIVGAGVLQHELVSLTVQHDLEDKVIFTGALDNKLVHKLQKECDIYVSLNMLGNLANSVIEAIDAGSCIVTFRECKKDFRDSSTERLLKDIAVLIDRHKVSEELPSVLNQLLTHPEEILIRREKTRRLSERVIKPWSERMDLEIDILEDLVR